MTLAEKRSFDVAKLGEVRSVAISPDGKTVAAGVRYGTVKLWDVDSGKERTLKGHVSDVWGVAFTPDGKTLASGDGDWNRPGEVKLWDLEKDAERTTLKHGGEVLCVAVSSDGKHLAAGGWDRTVSVWDLKQVLPVKMR
jgi:WD40 repeat protein